VIDLLSLRPYRSADRERVLELHETALRDADAFLEPGGEDGDDPGRGDYEADLEDVVGTYRDRDRATFLVGTLDGCVVSMGGIRPVEGHLADLLGPFERPTGAVKRLRVDPVHQGRGYGRRTLDALEERARERGYAALVLDTTPVQEAAIGLFEAAGYERGRRERVTVPGTDGGEAFTLLCYRKELR